MAKLISLYTCHEIIVDKNDDFVTEHEINLPHADEIADAFISGWNKDADDFMLAFMNKDVGKDRIKSCYARRYKTNDGTLTIAVEIVAKPNTRLSSQMKSEIFDFMSAQYSDGWGEGFFGPINIMQSADGTRFYVD